METLTETAYEESTFSIICTFLDEDNEAMTPVSVTWKLSDSRGNAINSRSAVTETPDEVVNIILTGDDLSLLSDKNDTTRKVTIWGTYNSSYGDGLKYTDEVTFTITNLTNISTS